jgi:hypothetical protein
MLVKQQALSLALLSDSLSKQQGLLLAAQVAAAPEQKSAAGGGSVGFVVAEQTGAFVGGVVGKATRASVGRKVGKTMGEAVGTPVRFAVAATGLSLSGRWLKPAQRKTWEVLLDSPS